MNWNRQYGFGSFIFSLTWYWLLLWIMVGVFVLRLALRLLKFIGMGIVALYRNIKAKRRLKELIKREDAQDFIKQMEYHATVLNVHPHGWNAFQINRAFNRKRRLYDPKNFVKYDSDFVNLAHQKSNEIYNAFYFFKQEFGV